MSKTSDRYSYHFSMQIYQLFSPFLLHVLIEVPACINFFFRPSATLPIPHPLASAIIRQYALLLMTSNIIAILFIPRPADVLSGQVAGALALYHFGPLVRAISRIRDGESSNALGGPWLHALLHGMSVVWLTLHAQSTGALF